MSAVLFAPHNDDETLFAFFQCLRHKPKVHVVFRSYRQWTTQNGPSWQVRERETACAMALAGCEWEQHDANDLEPDTMLIADAIAWIVEKAEPDLVIAPAWELGGHEDHNLVASIVNGIEGGFDRTSYLTYRRGHNRSTEGTEVTASFAEWGTKQQALACYASQIAHPATADWFGDDQREFIL